MYAYSIYHEQHLYIYNNNTYNTHTIHTARHLYKQQHPLHPQHPTFSFSQSTSVQMNPNTWPRQSSSCGKGMRHGPNNSPIPRPLLSTRVQVGKKVFRNRLVFRYTRERYRNSYKIFKKYIRIIKNSRIFTGYIHIHI